MKKIILALFFIMGTVFWLSKDDSVLNHVDLAFEGFLYQSVLAQEPCGDPDESEFEVDCPDGSKRIRCTVGEEDCTPTNCPIAST